MLKQRLMSAAVGLPLLLVLLIWGSKFQLSIFFFICVSISVYEISGIMMPALWDRAQIEPEREMKGKYLLKWQFFAILAGVVMFFVSTFGDYESGRGGIVLVITVLMLFAVFFHDNIETSILQLVSLTVSITYGCLPWLAVWDLCILGENSRYLLLALAIVMSNDTGGYFGGRAFGKNKLAPVLSPKKTWEGAISGVCSGVLAAWVVNLIFLGDLGPWWLMLIAALIAGVSGILGDLVESAFKRFAGVKDSGKLIPGHGGFLDRVDSLIFAAPALWFVLYVYRVSI